MKNSNIYILIFFLLTLFTIKVEAQNGDYRYSKLLNNGFRIVQSDSIIIGKKTYKLTVYRNDSLCFFVVYKKIKENFIPILKDNYWTNNSGICFKDQNNDGYKDIVWNKKWQDHAYLYNPNTENFVSVGEFHDIHELIINGKVVLYKNKFPLLYYWNLEKPLMRRKCSEDTMFQENHSELFIINKNYEKISFAVLDNFSTLNYEDLPCGDEMIMCYVPPYHGKFGKYSLWSDGVKKDSALIKAHPSFYNKYKDYAIDGNFISSYWKKNYEKYLEYGQVFKVRSEYPIEYFTN